jgi:hypothetical protein
MAAYTAGAGIEAPTNKNVLILDLEDMLYSHRSKVFVQNTASVKLHPSRAAMRAECAACDAIGTVSHQTRHSMPIAS